MNFPLSIFEAVHYQISLKCAGWSDSTLVAFGSSRVSVNRRNIILPWILRSYQNEADAFWPRSTQIVSKERQATVYNMIVFNHKY